MRGDLKMLRLQMFVAFVSTWSMVYGSGTHHIGGPIDNAPVVTAASSQYFQRNFNRLVTAPQLVPAPQLLHAAAPPQVLHAAAAPQLVPVAPAPQLFPVTANPQIHVAQAPSVFSVAPAPPVFVQATHHVPFSPQVFPFQTVQPDQRAPNQPVQPSQPQPQPQPAQPENPNVSISIATANAAAPVATFLLPPYPFGFPPPGFGFIPQGEPNNVDTKSQEPEQTTATSTTQIDVKTTRREPETTTPLPAASDNDFSQIFPPNQNGFNVNNNRIPASQQPQGFPSNQNVNFKQFPRPTPNPQGLSSNQNVHFRQYLTPTPLPPQAQPSNQNINYNKYLPASPLPQVQQRPPNSLPHHHHYDHHHDLHLHQISHGKPQKLKTLVEIVKAPLAYIAPQALPHHTHNHEAIKIVKHVHTFVPTKAKLIIRPVSHHHTRSVPVKVIEYKAHIPVGSIRARAQNVKEGNSREVEYTTLRPFPRANTKPPKL